MMNYTGELISLGVAASWTVAALSCEIASKRMGVVVLNVWRMGLALLFSALLLGAATGHLLPLDAGWQAWGWLLASGLVGYFFGDWCLFNSYLTMGSRFGQLFMTLAPAFTALFAWTLLGQRLSWHALLAMVVTLAGIAIAVGDRRGTEDGRALPLRGVLFGLGAALGQGLGLVLSKIGMDCYAAALAASGADAVGRSAEATSGVLSFGGNLVRCVAGLACYLLWYFLRQRRSSRSQNAPVQPTLRSTCTDRKALWAMLVAVVSGPFVGVGFSLMAVQYTAAGIASTLMATTPILILLPSRWLFGQPVTLRAVAGAVVSCVGVSLFFLL